MNYRFVKAILEFKEPNAKSKEVSMTDNMVAAAAAAADRNEKKLIEKCFLK